MKTRIKLFMMKLYGVKIVKRPHIKVSTSIDLRGEKGRVLIKKETEKVLIRQKNTLAKLATL